MAISEEVKERYATICTEIECCKCGNILKMYMIKEQSTGCDGNFRVVRSYVVKGGEGYGKKYKSKL